MSAGTNMDRRSLLCGGCALALSACGPAIVEIPDRRFDRPRNPSPEPTSPEPTSPEPTEPEPTEPQPPEYEYPLDNPDYPCNQPIHPGEDGWRPFDLAEYPQLEQVGGVATGATNQGKLFAVVHAQEGCYIASARRCTDLSGYITDWDRDRGEFVCPHGATFDTAGQVLTGPATVPLEVFFAAREGDTVWVYVTDDE